MGNMEPRPEQGQTSELENAEVDDAELADLSDEADTGQPDAGGQSRATLIHVPDEAAALGARVEFALMYARLKPMQLRKRLYTEYGIHISKSNVYNIVGGEVRRTKYFMEIAEICGVNAKWLATGKGFMVDMTGRVSTQEEALRQVRQLMTQHIIPPNRNDLVRFHGRLVTLMEKRALKPEVVAELDQLLTSHLGSEQ